MKNWNETFRSLNVGLPDDVERLKAAGYYQEAIERIDAYLAEDWTVTQNSPRSQGAEPVGEELPQNPTPHGVEALRDAMLAQREMMRRIPAEYCYTEDEAAELVESLDIYSLLQVVRHNATTVYSYITQGRQERSFNYRGEDLFRQKATLLYEETDQVTMEIVVATRTLELWLLEDMSLAVVSCVSVNYDHDGYITQYRTIKDTPVMDSELCLDLGELVEDLNGLCDPVYEHTQPVYEP